MTAFQKNAAPGIQPDGEPVFREGYVFGLREPSLQVAFTWRGPGFGISRIASESARLYSIDPRLERLPDEFESMPNDVGKVGHWALHWVVQIQRMAGLPVFGPGRVLVVRDMDPPRVRLLIPTSMEAASQVVSTLAWLFELANTAATGGKLKDVLAHFPKVLEALEQTMPRGSNTPRLMKAAYERGLPYTILGNEVVQYGQGRNSVWMQSTFTQRTSVISAQLARNKSRTAALLRRAGLPVATHYPVRNESEAVEVARQLGFPVVVKPADRDGGKAVAAGLRTVDAVRAAFRQAASASARILVEEHVDGRDYRVNVFQGEVVYAIERKAAGVMGDGSRTVEELVARKNADPNRGHGPHSALKRLGIDDEARSLLAEAGLTPQSVPEANHFVQLRRAANIALGGSPVRIDLADLHPDNAELAIRAVRLLRLDFAGVDLILPDIRQSWKTGGGVVCEVNGQPQLGRTTFPELPARILDRIIPGPGRIFCAVVLGDPTPGQVASALRDALIRQGVRVVPEGPDEKPFQAGQRAVLDLEAEVAVLDVEDESLELTGLPFDQIDVLVVCGRHLRGCSEDPAAFGRTRDFLLPACRGKVIDAAKSGEAPLFAVWPAGTDMPEVVTMSADAAVTAVVESYIAGSGPTLGRGGAG